MFFCHHLQAGPGWREVAAAVRAVPAPQPTPLTIHNNASDVNIVQAERALSLPAQRCFKITRAPLYNEESHAQSGPCGC